MSPRKGGWHLSFIHGPSRLGLVNFQISLTEFPGIFSSKVITEFFFLSQSEHEPGACLCFTISLQNSVSFRKSF